MSQKYWWKLIDDYSAMRWPCSEGFHVPMIKEWRDLIWALATVLSTDPNGAAMKIYLKMPLAGFRNFPWWWEDSKGSIGNYWTSTKHLWVNVWCIIFSASSTTINLQNYSSSRTYGYSIRWFKDSPIIPDNSWTVLYDGSSIATWAWVFHNATLWLISVSWDGITWYTIMDKNLWATTAYNDWDTLSEANCGKFYQRGNNYGFPRTWTMTMSSTKVDASWYWPGNYYSSDTFITGSGDWSSVRNDNLRWWVTWVQQKPANIIKKYYWWKTIVNYEDMQWPCPTWFHISASKDWIRAMNIWISLWAWNSSWDHMSEYLKIPPTWLRTNQAEFYWDWEMSVYLTPEIVDDDTPWWYYPVAFQFWFNEKYSLPNDASLWGANICDWCSIRPFKNVSVVPDSNWAVLYQWTWSAWIFHDASSWLISLSSDWENRITLADKNLWATEVYDYWDTLSHSNCWKLYQWWNNFWFLWQWNLLTTETKVDWSLYWPWNYYSFNEYYIEMWDITDRSSVRNDNRRWWVTWAERLAKVKKVYYWWILVDDYSAMRWPCPEWFHVPKSSERSAVINAWVSLWARTTSWTTSVTNFRTYLKLPNIVYLFEGNWLPWTWWTPQHRYYWWCRQTWSDWNWRYCDALDVVEDYWWSIRVDDASSNHWCPVRPFKDKPVIPDSTWTTLYSSDAFPGSRNIKHSQSLWLITISYDWTYITIADKNAGATSVYNFWDTITSANWWWLYQWWNNYPFPISWATTTSSTRVDTTWYGPWNYYSGSTFITGGANDDWFSPRNRDLWWWITWIQQKPILIREDNL